ncbi:MAG TPA: S8 family serine peptidase [Bryobacteraceae bacterium]|nr:S8 family serine peptidase [Bryobacteraceae bacterium]HPU72675.1 S8 family serine peptidase [Bryobacteraceae bacterium]
MKSIYRLLYLFLCASLLLAAGDSKKAKDSDDSGATPNRYVVRLHEGVSPTVLDNVAPGSKHKPLGGLNLHLLELPEKTPASVIEKLKKNPLVQYVEPDRIRGLNFAAPNDPNYSNYQWALHAVRAMDAWRLLPNRYLNRNDASGKRLTIAVLDTGADCTHPDFVNPGGASTDSAQGGQLFFEGSRTFVETTVQPPACAWQDDYGHGTHVAGIIGAAANNGVGIAGLGYPLKLMIYKVLDSKGKGADSSIAAGIMAAADAGADVISLSLGGLGYSQTFQDAVTYAWQRNSVVVASSGNTDTNRLFFPGGANHALGVAAVDSNGNKAAFSNYGMGVDVAAPGVSILSTVPVYQVRQGVKNYAYYSGTSMAAPYVAALAGLVAMITPGVAADAITMRIQQSADSPTSTWDQYLGYGTINAWRAVSGALRPALLGGLVGQVVNERGLPVAGAQISAGPVSFTTDRTGLFRFANLSAGDYTVTVAAFGYENQAIRTVVVPGADTTLTIRMGVSQGTLTGVVTSAGKPAGGVVVQAIASGLVQNSTVTDSAGRYWLTVPQGTYDVRASAVSIPANTVEGQTVAEGRETQVNFNLQPLGWIYGAVKDAEGRPVSGVELDITGSEATAGAITDSNGNFATIGLPPGEYTVSVAGGKASTRVTVAAGGGVRADLRDDKTGFAAIRVNSGGGAFVDSMQQAWSADYGYLGGNSYAVPDAGADLYRTERYGAFRYRFDVPAGNYRVNLHFAEIFFSRPGERVFDVFINGQKALVNFDIVAAAGGPNRAVVRQFDVSLPAPGMVIELAPRVENAKISGIEILPAGANR